MPHYKNGVAAKVGEVAVRRDNNGKATLGIITEITPGATTCNAQLQPVIRKTEIDGSRVLVPTFGGYAECVTLGELERIDF